MENQHIAIVAQELDKTAESLVDVLGLREIAKINNRGATGYHI